MRNILFTSLILLLTFQTMAQKKYTRQWAMADSLENLGQAQSALNVVTQIFAEGKAEGNHPQAIKAMMYRIRIESGFSEDYFSNAITLLSSELEAAAAPVRQVLSSILAQVYWEYYRNNQWEINQRTPLAGDNPGEISTWDARKFVSVTTGLYRQSLLEPALLQQTDIGAFEAILEKNKETRNLRPTLFDFLAFRAIDFFSSERASIIRPAAQFDTRDARYFGPVATFASFELASADPLSFEFQAMQLFQQLLRFRLSGSATPEPLVDTDLLRLAYVHRISTLPEKDSLYIQALRQLYTLHEGHPVSAEVAFALAGQLRSLGFTYQPLVSDQHKWTVKEALELAEMTAAKFPETDGGKNCSVLAKEIRSSMLRITANGQVVPKRPSLASVEYRNVDTLFIRILKADPEKSRVTYHREGSELLKELVRQKPLSSWHQVIPDDGDFQPHRTEIMIPPLDPGYYMLLVSSTKKFSTDSEISAFPFWSTSLSVMNRRLPDGDAEIMVLDRHTGSPLKGVRVRHYSGLYDYKKREVVFRAGEESRTDVNGYVVIRPSVEERQDRAYLLLTTRKDRFMTDAFFDYYAPYRETVPVPATRTFFFTDRSIYRPGQPIHFKGIVLDKLGNKSEVRKDYTLTVRFNDVNGLEIARREVRTNEFGSFSGTFTAPMGSLTGMMPIITETGRTFIRVEEYKRPKFEVTFDPVEGAYKLGSEVEVKGRAMAYAGGALTDAKVSYRVVRNARFPFYRWSPGERITPSRDMEIASGVIQTGDDGTFSIRFTAIPDLNVAESYDPVFTYTLYADVTDISGETRSGQTSVSAGYKAMEISTDLEEYMNGSDSLKIRVTTANLAGQPEPASGTVRVYKVIAPGQVLFTRKWPRPDKHTLSPGEFRKHFPGEVYDNEDDITTWQKGATIFTGDFKTPDERGMLIQANPQPGLYMSEIRSADRFGTEVVHTQYFNVYKPVSGKTEMTGPLTVQLTKQKAEPGESVSVVVASPLRKTTVRFEAGSSGGKLFQRTLLLDREQMNLEIPVFEEHRGNISFNFTMVYRNRVVRQVRTILVPYTNKELDITVGSFRSALEPGQEEEWQITVKDKKGDRVAAELLAGMYDASLDAFVSHAWPFSIYENFRGVNPWNNDLSFNTSGGIIHWYPQDFGHILSKEYESLAGLERYGHREVLFMAQSDAGSGIQIRGTSTLGMVAAAKSEAAEEASVFYLADENIPVLRQQSSTSPSVPGSDMVPAKPRTDFSETAFFFPQLATKENGETVLKFKMPESLTRWRMMGLAHTKDMKIGYLEKSLVTRKELMVFPNAPRFLREGDRMEFSARISNLSDQALNGKAEIRFFDAITMQPADDRMKVGDSSRAFSIKENGNALVTWEIIVPEGMQAVVYRITASAGSFSDGEEAALPVLTNRMLVTESLPLPVRGNSSKTYTFDKLLNSGKAGSTLRNFRLTLEYTSNPAWYAVQALPYLMEYPHECAEQVFSRLYANTLASHIANSDPKIRRVFDAWKMISPDALKSNLEKNEELKSLLIQETPWVREAKDESERKQRLGLLFDLNRMSQEQTSAYRKLSELQMANGGWPWFPGMPESEYITRHILAGLGRLKQSGALTASRFPDLETVTERAIRFLDQQMLKSYQKLKKDDPEFRKNKHLGNDVVHYLYARSYFYTELPEDSLLGEMVGYYREQSVQFWPRDNNYLKAMAALYLNRYGDRETAMLIMTSLSETALHNEETGMYWRNQRRGWFWYEAPVETHALLITAFDEVAGDEKAVEALKVWLLKQKQTQDWGTTKATAEAVHALLMRGESLLASDEPVQIRIGNKPVEAPSGEGTAREPGTGYFKAAWSAPEITPEMGRVEVKNPNHGPAWGALYWQYFEQLDKITSAGSPLSLKKELFREVNSPEGPVLEAITPEKPLQVGDKVVVRVILNADRDMEYVHLKDMRAAAFEPVNVLSGYRWQAGLGYYESTRDAATNFFIAYLPKGTWVFEYRLHATQKGEFSNGITTVQCMYAPEFGAHSEGIRIKVE